MCAYGSQDMDSCDIRSCDNKDAIKALEQEPRWIPVSERLPEEGIYLVCTDKGYIATIMYDRSMKWLLRAKIIAWMPLPQPYKAVGEVGESE